MRLKKHRFWCIEQHSMELNYCLTLKLKLQDTQNINSMSKSQGMKKKKSVKENKSMLAYPPAWVAFSFQFMCVPYAKNHFWRYVSFWAMHTLQVTQAPFPSFLNTSVQGFKCTDRTNSQILSLQRTQKSLYMVRNSRRIGHNQESG